MPAYTKWRLAEIQLTQRALFQFPPTYPSSRQRTEQVTGSRPRAPLGAESLLLALTQPMNHGEFSWSGGGTATDERWKNGCNVMSVKTKAKNMSDPWDFRTQAAARARAQQSSRMDTLLFDEEDAHVSDWGEVRSAKQVQWQHGLCAYQGVCENREGLYANEGTRTGETGEEVGIKKRNDLQITGQLIRCYSIQLSWSWNKQPTLSLICDGYN